MLGRRYTIKRVKAPSRAAIFAHSLFMLVAGGMLLAQVIR